jgi:hypothetical protein
LRTAQQPSDRRRPLATIAEVARDSFNSPVIVANRNSWKTLPPPAERERLELPLHFSDADAERMMRGHIPEDMDDKWFILFEEGWLYFHRSWTGHCIYGVRLDGSPGGVRVIEAWASRDREQYNSPGLETDLRMVKQLIDTRLLS